MVFAMLGNLRLQEKSLVVFLYRLHPDVWTYTIMIKGFCKNGLVDEASELLEKMDGNGCSPNEHTYNTIIHGFLQHRETSKAMKYLKMMVNRDFQQTQQLLPCLLTCCCLIK